MTTLRKENNPCYQCIDRKIGCHGKCNKYSEFKEKIDILRNKQRSYYIYRSDKTIDVYGKGYSTNKRNHKVVLKITGKK